MSPRAASSGDRRIALWAGLVALFTNLAAVKFILLFGSNRNLAEIVAAILTAIAVAGVAYSRERLDAAKRDASREDQHT